VIRHSVNELTGIAYSYYPRGFLSNDPRYEEATEHRRLVAARRQAGADNEPWRAMLKRLDDKFPEISVQDRSLHLPSGGWDACYSACLYLPTAPGEYHHTVGFMVSFLVPYYVIYSSRTVDDLEEIKRMKARRADPARSVDVFVPYLPDTMFILPAWMVKILPACMVKPESPLPIEAYRNVISFDFSPDEQPYAAWIAQDIEATWRESAARAERVIPFGSRAA
jgi:hypothetical protein